jgi:triacylglycerol lipase
MNVVMVHGFADTGRLFRTMGATLDSRGHTCRAPTLEPRDGRLGIQDLSKKIDAFIEANVPRQAPLALVGFSMGAVVLRHYLQVRGGASRARAFFSISGPHNGTWISYLYPGAGTRQMRLGSAFLRELDAGTAALSGLVLHTYRTPLDLMVAPSTSARIRGVTERVVWCPLHSLMPSDPRVVNHIADELARIDTSATPGLGCPPV